MAYGDVTYDFASSELWCKECHLAVILEFPSPSEQDRLVVFCGEVEKFMCKHEECGSDA